MIRAAELVQGKGRSKKKQCQHRVCIRAMMMDKKISPLSRTALSARYLGGDHMQGLKIQDSTAWPHFPFWPCSQAGDLRYCKLKDATKAQPWASSSRSCSQAPDSLQTALLILGCALGLGLSQHSIHPNQREQGKVTGLSSTVLSCSRSVCFCAL